VLRQAAVEGHAGAFRQLDPRFGVVSEHGEHPRAIAFIGRDAMDGVAPTKQDEIACVHGEDVGRRSAVEQGGNALVVHLSRICVAQVFDVFERASCVGFLDQQGDRERGIVEVPAKFLPPFGVVDVDGGERVGVWVQLRLTDGAFDEGPETGIVIEVAEGAIRGDDVIADAAFGRDDLAIDGMSVGKVWIVRSEVDRVVLGAEIGFVLSCFSLGLHGGQGTRLDQIGEHEDALAIQLLGTCGDKALIGERVGLQIDDIAQLHG